jgi:NAD(P)-dependent dehydrogenase (short-subunit alcohol dehydrogenase family)
MAGTPIRFDGQVALVTGGGAGMGRSYAHQLAERGAKIVIMDYPAGPLGGDAPDSGGREKQVEAEIRALGGEAIGVEGSVFDDADARRAVQAAIDAWGRIDILVNNAGTSETRALIHEEPTEWLDPQINVHVKGPMMMTRAAWPHFIAQNYGRVVMTSSATIFGWGDELGRWKGGYAVAKSAVLAIVRQLAGAGEAHCIKTNMVMPWAYSRMVHAALAGTPFEQWQRKLTPDQMVAGVLLLLHGECPVNGQAISSAGGRVAQVYYASPRGYFNRALTPEDVRDNWDQVAGNVSADGMIGDMMEMTGSRREWALLQELIP